MKIINCQLSPSSISYKEMRGELDCELYFIYYNDINFGYIPIYVGEGHHNRCSSHRNDELSKFVSSNKNNVICIRYSELTKEFAQLGERAVLFYFKWNDFVFSSMGESYNYKPKTIINKYRANPISNKQMIHELNYNFSSWILTNNINILNAGN